MSLNLTQITLESVNTCVVNTVSTSAGTLSYATACIGIDAVNASSVQCYSISAAIDSTCDSILHAGINANAEFECSNTCQVLLPATHLASSSVAAETSVSATFSDPVETSSDAPHPGFSTNPPFNIATYTLVSPNTATNLYPSFVITFIALFFILFIVKK
ncbi:hypothetical protein BDF21DRAFT_494815 [Thamnidium elegans]|uniref:Transmembrane protein n=1 Tax=Thamnidium elegans TaxID=101142 RepID=A0A8H7SPJ7_9FUNG|nr:hypothetical protein INT48_005672 [Thamnidium elegans]KAI8076053.1 hypothetical protein BDF21DRAFT_494815 [Thamnidium elegans]